eukprot:m51a1_g14056 hypothetical protein (230) ;mRNA; r:1209286-1210112
MAGTPPAPRPRLTVVAFDFDDTLVGIRESFFRSHSETAASLGLPPPTREQCAAFGPSWDAFILSVWPTAPVEEFKQRCLALSPVYTAAEVPGANASLQSIADHGMRMYVVSKRLKRNLGMRVQQAGLRDDLIERAWCFDDLEHQKPDPRCFDGLKALRPEIAEDPRRAVYVGDTPDDYKAAAGAGFHFIGVCTGYFGVRDFAAAGLPEDRVIPSVGELGKYLEDCDYTL